MTTKLNVRFTLLTNELPRLTDASSAMSGRLLLLNLTRSWYGREDLTLQDRLMAELPGILLWAIGGWRRLGERGRFTQPRTTETLQRELEDLTSPIGAFIRERCVTGARA